uniref:Receptor (G protein-coupled) activity modifying protein 2 n=1 Tax=Neogobius melanostomus TaxID=47308 RepID=A0A8C6WQT6_9GOBI
MSEHLSPVTVNNMACRDNSTRCMILCEHCNENFPDEKMECLLDVLQLTCLKDFNTDMNHSDTDWCNWEKVRGLYSDLSICTEKASDCLSITYPNPLVEKIFLDIHSQYFQDCPSEELSDPPPPIVFALVITPICLIPVMVSLVVLKTKNGDGST